MYQVLQITILYFSNHCINKEMKKTTFLLTLFCVIYFNINAQEVISSSGDYYENSNGSVSWTIGESITETITDGNFILTQGFQQSRLTTVSIFELEDLDFKISISPNPTIDNISLNTNKSEGLSYQLYDFNGKLIKEATIISKETIISFSDLSYASYFLSVLRENQIIKTFQVIKQ